MIKSDSRRIKKGDIFIALPGIKSDGHNYIDGAIKNGASRVIAMYGNYSVPTTIVSSTKQYLKDYVLDSYSKISGDLKVLGVTGTNGKTTIAYLLYQALNKLGIKCSMIGTLGYYKSCKFLNLPNTCPDLALMHELIIDSYNSGYKFIVVEASSQGLVEDRLYGLKFDYAIFTNLTHDHLDYHGSMESYALAKQILFKNLKATGVGIVNIDSKYSKYFLGNNTITYGFNDCDYKIISYGDYNFSYFNDKVYHVNHNLIGKYNVYNLMAIIIVLLQLGFNVDIIFNVVKDIVSPKGRMEIYNYLNNKIIVDYAHTPDAIKQVLSSITNYNKLYVVFGCTGNRDRSKRPIMTNMLLKNCDFVFITSDDLYDEDFNHIVSDMLSGNDFTNYSICPDRSLAIYNAIKLLDFNDILLILGKGHEEYLKVGSRLIPFNDGNCVLSLLENINK